ncbi:Chitinase A1 [Grifola frondosa]|uniref:Chitinase A1 n=1 Tax=Grifola frondosa TaxID=5627 RepID=A0A1C7MM17_GRIFR|nr:Chitinase A1 [Grifola frondosa]
MLFLSLTLLAALPLVPVWAVPMCSVRSQSTSVSSPTGSSTTPSPTASGSQAVSSSSSTSGGSNLIATSWYAGWETNTISSISWDKYSAVKYCFAVTTSDGNVSLADSNEADVASFVQAAHQHNTKAMVTIGGWTGSQYFSTNFGSAENRTNFVNTVLGLVTKYNLDGLDFDWEYPNRAGAPCNIISSSDSANYLSFLQELRFAKVLDYIEIMNYDVFGLWTSTAGPNSPLNDTCAPSADQQGSAVSAVKAWTAAGFPASQIALGVASYGHSYSVSTSEALPDGKTLALFPTFSKTVPQGDSSDTDAASTTECGVLVPGGFSGIWNFNGLINGNVLTSNGTVNTGYDYTYDECSQTPFIYDPKTQVYISYDNAQSFGVKGNYIKQAGLLGFAMWETASDSNDILLDAIRSGMGL